MRNVFQRPETKGRASPIAGDGMRIPQRPVPWLRVFAFISCALLPAYSQSKRDRPTDLQVEAAYLFNFGKFVRWPSNTDTPVAAGDSLEICVLGKDPFGSVLKSTIRGETIEGRPVVARTVLTVQETESCRILFVSSSEEGRLTAILPAIRHQGALTVSNIPHFAERGGMIEFVNLDDRIRFAVNISSVREAGIGLSSELLKVATKVIGQSGGTK